MPYVSFKLCVFHKLLLKSSYTYSMQQSPSWEANRFSASQEIPRILWNSNVHYRIQKCPPQSSSHTKYKIANSKRYGFLSWLHKQQRKQNYRKGNKRIFLHYPFILCNF